jgi:serine/threonine protein kinase
MELAPQGSLMDLISAYKKRNEYLVTAQIQSYLQQLSSALEHCHDVLGVIHRDIKPENILLGDFCQLKLADFGLAKQSICCDTKLGSPLYMPPEMCREEEDSYGPAVDIWSCGCVIYELVTLQPVWSAKNLPALIIKILTEKPIFDHSFDQHPDRLCETVRWMLKKNPSSRPTAKQLIDLTQLQSPPTLGETLPFHSEMDDVIRQARLLMNAPVLPSIQQSPPERQPGRKLERLHVLPRSPRAAPPLPSVRPPHVPRPALQPVRRPAPARKTELPVHRTPCARRQRQGQCTGTTGVVPIHSPFEKNQEEAAKEIQRSFRNSVKRLAAAKSPMAQAPPSSDRLAARARPKFRAAPRHRPVLPRMAWQ